MKRGLVFVLAVGLAAAALYALTRPRAPEPPRAQAAATHRDVDEASRRALDAVIERAGAGAERAGEGAARDERR